MIVKIIACHSDKYWYADKIGEIYKAYPEEDGYYELMNTPMQFIYSEDCQEMLLAQETDTVSKLLPSEGGDPAYLQLLEDMKQLHIKKNAGYSGDSQDRWANFRLSETFGISAFLGVMVRMSDKWIRITNLIKNPSFDQVGESIDDTLFDLAAYALIAICIRREKKGK